MFRFILYHYIIYLKKLHIDIIYDTYMLGHLMVYNV